MVIAVNPKDKFFYHRLKTFPSLVNCTTINWFLDWPEFAYTSIAQNLILDHQIFYSQDKEKGGLIFEKNLMEKIIKISYFCYQDYIKRARQMSKEIRRKLFATPLNFIRFLKILNKFIENFDKENNILIERYEKGVEKIIQTEQDVQKMRVDLENLQIRLQDLKVDNQQIIEDIQVKSEEVDQKKKMCEQEEKETQKQKDEAEQLQEECESDLSKVLPILKQAADALNNIKKDDLTKMKSYANPSESIRLVMEGVCFALGVDKNVPLKPKAPGSLEKVQDFWDYSKKHLLNDKLQKTIKNHNKEQILNLEPKNIQKLKKLIENPDFDKEKIKQASQAAYNLSNWIRAVHSVYEVMKIIEPKREKLGEAKKTLEITTKLLQEKIESLNEVTGILDNLQAEYAKASQEKKSIEEKVLNVKQKLERAEKLITGLAGEKEEWKIKGKQCRQFSNNILGDAVMCANIVAYHGPFPIQFRDKNFKKLRKFLNSQDIDFRENFKIQDILSNAIEIETWISKYKLQNDNFSIDNVVIIKQSQEWPICIDPQNQANQFIKEKEAQNQIKIINPHKPVQEILSVVENTLQLGLPLLIENFSGDIQPTALEPLILKKFQYDGSVFKVKLGDKLVEGKSDFKLYITCQKTNHIFSSNLTGNCQMIDFSVTQEGLQDHMLNIVVQIEEPYKEQQRLRNIQQLFQNKVSMDINEKNILQLISSSKGEDLLSDEQLVQALETNKNESYNMKEKLEKLQIDQVFLNKVRNFYTQISQQASSIFFVLIDLSYIDNLYQFSLEWYIEVFQTSLKKQSRQKYNSKNNKSQKNILIQFLKALFSQVSHSIQSQHIILFSFLVCTKLLIIEGNLTVGELRFMAQGKEKIQENNITNPNPSWLTNSMWNNILELFKQFPNIYNQEMIDQFKITYAKQFEEFFKNKICVQNLFRSVNEENSIQNSENQENIFDTSQKLPENWENLPIFHKLILLKCLKPEQVVEGMQYLIKQQIGEEFYQQNLYNLENILLNSKCTQPILFVLQSGTDIQEQIQQIAQKKEIEDKFIIISLGQGNIEKAEQIVYQGIKNGNWIMLQNCHLAPSFVPKLEKICAILNLKKEINKEFRLILTTHATQIIPVEIVQKSLKLRQEQPQTIKNSLNQAYQFINTNIQFQKLHYGQEKWQRLYFLLSFFHAILSERIKFGPLGWNKPYEFTMSDLSLSLNQVKTFLEKNDENELNSLKALQYIIKESNYGGKITDKHDRKLLGVVLDQYINQKIYTDEFKISEYDKVQQLYKLPEIQKSDFWIDHYQLFQQYPQDDEAEVFGLDKNAQISAQIQNGQKLMSSILQLLPKNQNYQNDKIKQSVEQQIKEKCEFFLNQLPQDFNESEIEKKIGFSYKNNLNTVIIMEVKRYNKLLKLIKNSLNTLIGAIEGINIMHEENENIFNKIYENQVPQLWQSYSYNSAKKLGSWITDLIKRLNFINEWVTKGEQPKIFWVGGFFYTQSFFTAILQNYSRQKNIAIDNIDYAFEIMSKVKQEKYKCGKLHPENGCYIKGLYIEGGSWDKKSNVLNDPKPGQLFAEMPIIWCRPLNKKWIKIRRKLIKNIFQCPLYNTTMRRGQLSSLGISSNWLLDIDLPIKKGTHYKQWILRGVALISQLDD